MPLCALCGKSPFLGITYFCCINTNPFLGLCGLFDTKRIDFNDFNFSDLIIDGQERAMRDM